MDDIPTAAMAWSVKRVMRTPTTANTRPILQGHMNFEKNAARLSELAPASVAEAVAAGELDLSPALELVERYRGVADTVRRAEQHMTRAAAAIAPFSEGQAKEDLLAAAHFAVGRDR